MTKEEEDWIKDHPETCKACGHLNIFHNGHCCEFCMVENCSCKFGELTND